MQIIIDRKHKRANFDNNWNDPLGVEAARESKTHTIEIPKGSDNPVHKFIEAWGHKALLGKIAYCLTDKNEIMSGYIVDVVPSDYLILRDKGVARFKDCISLGG